MAMEYETYMEIGYYLETMKNKVNGDIIQFEKQIIILSNSAILCTGFLLCMSFYMQWHNMSSGIMQCCIVTQNY